MSDALHHWTNRFTTPSSSDLLSVLPADAAACYTKFRDLLLDLDGVSSMVAWYSEPWRWTECFVRKSDDEPLGILVPNPEDLQFAMPLDRAVADALAEQRLKRTILDGLEMSRDPFDTRWSVWSVTSTSIVDDLHTLVRQKIDLLDRVAS